MKIFLQPLFRFLLVQEEQLSVNGKCTFSTGKLPPGGLPRNSVVNITDSPNMTSAIYHAGPKALNEKKNTISND